MRCHEERENMLDSEAIKERINNGHYSSAVNARRAIGQIQMPKKAKKELQALVAAKMPGEEKEVRTRKAKVTRRKATRKRRTDGKVLNGAGDSRTVTLFKLSQYPDAFSLMAHLIAKAVDEHATLPELHEDVKSIASLLQL